MTKATKAWEFLKSNRLAAIATIAATGAPQASLVYYIANDNSHLYLVTSTESRKIRNILRNNKVALVIGQEIEPVVLQLEGEAEMIDDHVKKKEIINRYLDLANQSNPGSFNWPPVLKIPSESGFIVVEVTITWFKFSDFSGPEGLIMEGAP